MEQFPQVEFLSGKYRGYVAQSCSDIRELSGLHPDFIDDCLKSIREKEEEEGRLPVGEMFPLMIAEGIDIPPPRKKLLSAACLALYGYIRLVDKNLDTSGVLDSRTAMSASALLGWGIATLAEVTARTPYSVLFTRNIAAALSAQHGDLVHRADATHDRSGSDIDKNRAIVATVAAFCAASEKAADHLIGATEGLLGPFQRLDDLADLYTDLAESNLTPFARMAAELCPSRGSLRVMSPSEVYGLVFQDVRTVTELESIASALRRAVSTLKPETDGDFIAYLNYLENRVATLVTATERYQTGDRSALEDIGREIGSIRVDV